MRRSSIVPALALGLVLVSLSLPTQAAPAKTADGLMARAEALLGDALEAARTLLADLFPERSVTPVSRPEPAAKARPVSNSPAERRIVIREGCVLDPFGKPCGG